MNPSKHQRGTAIIVALFIVGLVAVIAVTMMARLNRDIRRTELLLHSIQAGLYAQGSIAWAIDTLMNEQLQQQTNKNNNTFPISSPIDQINGYTLSSTIYDVEGLFNLNNLINPEWAPHFQRLLQIVDSHSTPETAQKITESIVNWISPNVKNMDDDLYYNKLPRPYRASHRPMVSASELRLIRGITRELYINLLPYVSALPEITQINVNTAPTAVLQSLSQTLDKDGTKAIELYRQQTPFTSIDQFLALDIVRNHTIAANKITVHSHYFLINTKVFINEQHLVLYSLLHRSTQNGKPLIDILWQSKGTM